jgi:Na+/proline symporter
MTLIATIIIVVYLAGIVVVGICSRGRQENIRDYFTAQQGFKGVLGPVLVGLSIGATLFSGLSFVAYPSIIYTHGVTVLTSLIGFPVAYLVLRFWFLPRYLATPQDSPYDIIERCYDRTTRKVASGMFVMLRLCWLSALIFAPVLVVMAAGSLDSRWFWPLVLLVGLSSTAYTVVGGIRGVIVTDAIQFLLIMGVLLATMLFVAFKLPLTLSEVTGYMRAESDLLTLNWSLSPTQTITVWAMIIGGTMQNMSSFIADQMSLQRYLAVGGARPATAAFGTSMLTTTLVLVLLAGVGLTLGAWYHFHPDLGLPDSADKVFPYFVAHQLPLGFSGLIIAAILAATMSSITSGVNALSGSLLNDFVPLAERIAPGRLLTWGRVTSAMVGLAATLAAGFVSQLGTLFNAMNIFLGVFLGPLLGCMVCSIVGLRVRGPVLVAGMITGCLTAAVMAYSPVSSLWTTLVSSLVTVLIAGIGWAVGWRQDHRPQQDAAG